jgi:hypothetical protein
MLLGVFSSFVVASRDGQHAITLKKVLVIIAFIELFGKPLAAAADWPNFRILTRLQA